MILKKENTTSGYPTGLDIKVAIPSPKPTKKISFKKQFKKTFARKLGVKYKTIKHLFPRCLNSTLIANHLHPSVPHFTREEIRDISQQLKLEFDAFR